MISHPHIMPFENLKKYGDLKMGSLGRFCFFFFHGSGQILLESDVKVGVPVLGEGLEALEN